ncbi:hypothetical protein D7X74_07720 [Corallococcus sp. CA047B]|uniref:hypothetical protein n=1 Tax=Corallococcus sp. CA047B TaxID=2316729 RepID=UPI000EA04DAC|nr:hypothetical protein [Corallococcus sp. CA047B]RKH19169.1 hypothetical protein D7X74_07720 [Corallococcus sp. CA047B]
MRYVHIRERKREDLLTGKVERLKEVLRDAGQRPLSAYEVRYALENVVALGQRDEKLREVSTLAQQVVAAPADERLRGLLDNRTWPYAEPDAPQQS